MKIVEVRESSLPRSSTALCLFAVPSAAPLLGKKNNIKIDKWRAIDLPFALALFL
jgi:hypothetical protein